MVDAENGRVSVRIYKINHDKTIYVVHPALCFIVSGIASKLLHSIDRAGGIAFCKLLQGAGAGVRHIEYPAARFGFIEIAASGRMKKNFYTSAKTVQAQLHSFEQALADITCYLKEIV